MTSVKLFYYDHVTIDLDMRVAIREDGETVPLVGRVYDLIETLLRKPGRIHTYWEIAQRILPDWLEDCSGGWGHLSLRQRHSIKRVLQMTVLRARQALGDKPGHGRILLNRMNAGYGMRPCRVSDPLPASASLGLGHIGGAQSNGAHAARGHTTGAARPMSAACRYAGTATRRSSRSIGSGHAH